MENAYIVELMVVLVVSMECVFNVMSKVIIFLWILPVKDARLTVVWIVRALVDVCNAMKREITFFQVMEHANYASFKVAWTVKRRTLVKNVTNKKAIF